MTVTGRAAVAPPAPVIVKVQVPAPTGVTVIVAPAIAAVAIVVGQPAAVKAPAPFACVIVAVFAFVGPTALKLRLVGALATAPGVGVADAVGVGVAEATAVGVKIVEGNTVLLGPQPANVAAMQSKKSQVRKGRESYMITPKKTTLQRP